MDLLNEVMFETLGRADTENHYPFAVMVDAQVPEGGERIRECGGVLVSSRLVLTAGHCVCPRSKVPGAGEEAAYVLDGATCVKSALVTLLFYKPPTPQEGMGTWSLEQLGRVRLHPRFHVRLDARGNVVSSQADMAAIFLDTPVPDGFRPVRLAETEVVPGESLTRVGFGYDDALGALDGRRLAHESRVLKALDPERGRFLFEPDEPHVFKGDDGGPCLREADEDPVLVGISTVGLGHEPTLTSTKPYLDWLRDEIQLAQAVPAGGTHDALPGDGSTP